METFSIAEAFTTVAEVREQFGLRRNPDPDFLAALVEDLPELGENERANLDSLKADYLYQSDGYVLTESTINLLLLSPLLQMAGFFRPPFKIRSEVPVEVNVPLPERTYRGRIDTLVIQQRFWVLMVESKHTRLSFQTAVPQALVYLLGAPEPQTEVYGLVTNGDGFRFIKLVRPAGEYDLTQDFSLFSRHNELHDVLRVLKRIATLLARTGPLQ